ncbi:MAG TPA: hypothetical protein VLN49_08995 [Gemmatimonadaceae bacterium]|nr:hypothetical protein [Gemmatimonadaceae bacterium]
MARESTERASASGVSRLVEAERSWQQSLEAARASADAVVAQAETDARRVDEASGLDARHVADCRRSELEAALADAVREAEAALGDRVERYSSASDALIDALARQAVAHAPWFVAVEDA